MNKIKMYISNNLRYVLSQVLTGVIIGACVSISVNLSSLRHQGLSVQVGLGQGGAYGAIVSESNVDHGKTMEEVMSGISDEPYEHLAIFCGERKIVERTDYSGYKNSYAYYAWRMPGNNMTLLHNHPKECSFSYGDLDGLFRYKYFGTAVVVTGGTKYTLSAPNGWPDVAELTQFFESQFNIYIIANENGQYWPDFEQSQLLQLCEDGYVVQFDDNYGFSGKMIAEIADYFDLDYNEEPLS